MFLVNFQPGLTLIADAEYLIAEWYHVLVHACVELK